MKAFLKDYRELGIRSISMKKIMSKQADYLLEANLLRDYIHKFGFAFIDTEWYNEEDVTKAQNLVKQYHLHRENHPELAKKDERPEYEYRRGRFEGSIYEVKDSNAYVYSNPILKKFFAKIQKGNDIFGDLGALDDHRGLTVAYRNEDLKKDPNFIAKNYPKNIDIPDFPELGPSTEKVALTLEKTGECVLDALSLSLGLEEKDSLKNFTKYGDYYMQNLCTFNIHKKPVGHVMHKLHFDRDLITVHTRSNYPCLVVYTTEDEARRIIAKPPPGALLVQAGLQLEWLSGGYFASGLHEVIVTEEAKEKATENVANGGDGHRITQTLFIRAENNIIVGPYDKIKDFHLGNYPPKLTTFSNDWKETDIYKRI